MRAVNRCGFMLFELLVTLLLTTLLAAIVGSAVVALASSARRHARALDQQRSEAAVAAWWRADLRDSEAGDVTVPVSDRLLAHHPVGGGVPCFVSGASLWIARSDWRGLRDPEPGRDELWLLTTAAPATWDAATFFAVGGGNCPDGTAALRLTLGTPAATVLLARAVEPVQVRLYRSGSSWWFGLAPADGSAPVQPFAGPLDPLASRFVRDSSGVHVFMQSPVGRALELLAPLPTP